MGFKNLSDFNLALLGKQVWRLLTIDKSLVSRLFKARYFPKGSILEAQLGSNPSYIWRSMFAARDMVKVGSGWRVGSGDQIHVFRQHWLPDADHPYVTSDHITLNDVCVSSLLQVGRREWDEDVIEDMFNNRDKALIYSILLGDML